jgi:nicotinamidase-related amidase
MNYSLILIDMQKFFAAANSRRVQKGCREAIQQAIVDKAPIILVEYQGYLYKRTVKALTNVINKANYKYKFVVTKDDDDGADEVYQLLIDYKLPHRKIKVCGVNTDCCVYSTVLGLIKRHKFKSNNIEIISNACGSICNRKHVKGLRELKFIGVKIVNYPA